MNSGKVQLENFKKITEMIRYDEKVHRRPPKKQISTVVQQNCKKLVAKHSMEKSSLL